MLFRSTEVEYTPGVCQNFRSAPQKQPMPNTAVCIPSGHGGVSGEPSTKWRSGTGIVWSVRPGRAASGVTISVFVRNSMRARLRPTVARVPDVLVRTFVDGDIPAALTLNNASVPDLNELDESAMRALLAMADAALVAEVDGRFAGFCWVMLPGQAYAS